MDDDNPTGSLDPQSLLLDLNELLRRDPTLSSLDDKLNSSGSSIGNINTGDKVGVAIPGRSNTVAESNSPFASTFYTSSAPVSSSVFLGSSISNDFGDAVNANATFSRSNLTNHGSSSTASMVMHSSHVDPTENMCTHHHQQPTLAELNSPKDESTTMLMSGSRLQTLVPSGLGDSFVKMEVNDFEDLDDFMLRSTVSGTSGGGGLDFDLSPDTVKQEAIVIKREDEQSPTAAPSSSLVNPNFWQANTDEMLFGGSGTTTGMGGLTSGICRGATNSPNLLTSNNEGCGSLLSSSVPVSLFHTVSSSPLSDILPDFSSITKASLPENNLNVATAVAAALPSLRPRANTVVPGLVVPRHHHQLLSRSPLPPPNSPSPSHLAASPTRHSTLQQLLVQRKGVFDSKPCPVRSPDGRKTLEQMRNSLSSSSHPLVNQQILSHSAPVSASTSTTFTSGCQSSADRSLWSRREPRQHISSVCSVGESSSIADEVNDILASLSPNDDVLQDILSDEEYDDNDYKPRFEQSSDDDSDFEATTTTTTSPSVTRLSTSAGSSGCGNSSKKSERHFWQYNVQAKGPKGHRIYIKTKVENPHSLDEIVDPVFSGDVQFQGIKHSGKARRGDGNDLTVNPRKLAAIGKELEQLSHVINDMTPVSEIPFAIRCKTRKDKNKVASRACRLKKKAQHEANKLKCHGLLEEHKKLSSAIQQVKGLLYSKLDQTNTRPQAEITAEINEIVKGATKQKIAGNTTNYVNEQIEKELPFV